MIENISRYKEKNQKSKSRANCNGESFRKGFTFRNRKYVNAFANRLNVEAKIR
jgi:hypothetical protein